MVLNGALLRVDNAPYDLVDSPCDRKQGVADTVVSAELPISVISSGILMASSFLR